MRLRNYSEHQIRCVISQVISESGALIESFPIDSKPFYVFGRIAKTSDITLVSPIFLTSGLKSLGYPLLHVLGD